ncbi:helix-turn-helix domain-containing protein [Variovorax sp. 770b2]|uniref:helix-turn-helix domain-containing protein n=1 Tax=Variovorax sp. 770b2 TaxID=1566271 RepID=UPI0008E90DDA|nr:helix-turn-helix domain-containing protein [Variovorax sp. 770b2]SFQ04510.1 Helix-turn-helix domain-containing protein [Variovorax sp. 770b2]
MFFFMFSAMTRACVSTTLRTMVLDGAAQDAASLALESLEATGGVHVGESAMEHATLAADLMLAQDRAEEAEDIYRLALTAAISTQRGQVRVVSCRNIGFVSLYQRRYGAAANSFQRVAEDDAATLPQQIEALAGLSLTHHALGRNDVACQALDDAAQRLAKAGSCDAQVVESLHLFLRIVRVELAAQYAIRTNAALADHIFWQSESAYAGARPDEVELLVDLNACAVAAAGRPLLVQRLEHLISLVRAGMGDAGALDAAHGHLARLRKMHLAGPERQCRLETALVAVANRNAELTRSLLEPLSGRHGEAPQRWNFELSYCRAKLCEMTGQSEEGLRHYQRYALESAMCLRNEMQGLLPRAAMNGRTIETRDEMELALPAKYRRGYRYLLAHMDRADLSVREIAEHVGVSERAVQSAFRTHLGMTPIEVLRRTRVERIRRDLLNAEVCSQTVIETAARWGIRNRSTLVSSYRKHFRETPADTLARRDIAVPVQA